MSHKRNLCCAVLKRVGKYAVCSLDAGHSSAHWDAELRISWDDKQAVELTRKAEVDAVKAPAAKEVSRYETAVDGDA